MKCIRIHYYGTEYQKRKLINDVITPIVKLEEFINIKFFIKRDWKFGPNIGIYVEECIDNAININKLLINIMQRANSFMIENPSKIIFNKNKITDVLKNLAKLENYKKDYLPINENYTFIIETINDFGEGYYNSELEHTYITENKYKSAGLTLESNQMLISMDKKEQLLFLIEMLYIIGELYPEKGIRHGCISFKSHIEGFFANSDIRTKQLKKKFNSIYDVLGCELDSIIENNHNNIISSTSQRLLLDKWKVFFQIFINSIYYNSELKEKLQYENKISKISINKLQGYTPFHNDWVSKVSFADFFFSDSFYRYRLTVNFFYMLLPSLGFTPEDKHLGCYLITNAIEKQFKVNLIDLIKL